MSESSKKSNGWSSLMLGVLFFFWGAMMFSEYQEKGFIYDNKHGQIIAYDGLALFICFLMMIVGGFFFIFGSNRVIASITTETNKVENYICPNCQTLWPAYEIDDAFCLKCQIILENLDGFYERHPDLSEKPNHAIKADEK